MIWSAVAEQYAELSVNIIEEAGNRAQQNAWRLVRPTTEAAQPFILSASETEMRAGT
jgi:hypothetical protein